LSISVSSFVKGYPSASSLEASIEHYAIKLINMTKSINMQTNTSSIALKWKSNVGEYARLL